MYSLQNTEEDSMLPLSDEEMYRDEPTPLSTEESQNIALHKESQHDIYTVGEALDSSTHAGRRYNITSNERTEESDDRYGTNVSSSNILERSTFKVEVDTSSLLECGSNSSNFCIQSTTSVTLNHKVCNDILKQQGLQFNDSEIKRNINIASELDESSVKVAIDNIDTVDSKLSDMVNARCGVHTFSPKVDEQDNHSNDADKAGNSNSQIFKNHNSVCQMLDTHMSIGDKIGDCPLLDTISKGSLPSRIQLHANDTAHSILSTFEMDNTIGKECFSEAQDKNNWPKHLTTTAREQIDLLVGHDCAVTVNKDLSSMSSLYENKPASGGKQHDLVGKKPKDKKCSLKFQDANIPRSSEVKTEHKINKPPKILGSQKKKRKTVSKTEQEQNKSNNHHEAIARECTASSSQRSADSVTNFEDNIVGRLENRGNVVTRDHIHFPQDTELDRKNNNGQDKGIGTFNNLNLMKILNSKNDTFLGNEVDFNTFETLDNSTSKCSMKSIVSGNENKKKRKKQNATIQNNQKRKNNSKPQKLETIMARELQPKRGEKPIPQHDLEDRIPKSFSPKDDPKTFIASVSRLSRNKNKRSQGPCVAILLAVLLFTCKISADSTPMPKLTWQKYGGCISGEHLVQTLVLRNMDRFPEPGCRFEAKEVPHYHNCSKPEALIFLPNGTCLEMCAMDVQIQQLCVEYGSNGNIFCLEHRGICSQEQVKDVLQGYLHNQSNTTSQPFMTTGPSKKLESWKISLIILGVLVLLVLASVFCYKRYKKSSGTAASENHIELQDIERNEKDTGTSLLSNGASDH